MLISALSHFSKLFEIDIRNIMGMLFWGNLTLSILDFAFYFSNRNKSQKINLLIFGFSKIAQALAWLEFFQRTDITSFHPLNMVVTNSLVIIGLYLESISMLMLVRGLSKKVFRGQLLLFCLTLLSFYIAIWVEAPANIRISIVSISIFLLLITPTYQFLTERPRSQFRTILAYNYVGLLMILTFRAILPLFHTSMTLYSVFPIHSFLFLIVFIMMIISGVGYLLLLQEDKEMQIQKLLDDKDKFFSIIAHDLRGPFNGIIGLSELILDKENKLDDKETYEFVQLIHQSSKNTFSLLENLLTWSQSQTGSIAFNPKKTEISSIIDKTINLLSNIANNKNISIRSEIKEKQYVIADKNMLETIFRNLISNAIKFTKQNGHVFISMKKEKDQIVFSVEDNGIGIAPEKIMNLFMIDTRNSTLGTNDETGTGLGLMLCKDFVEKHGGKIWVKSQVGKGSVFMFNIPNKF